MVNNLIDTSNKYGPQINYQKYKLIRNINEQIEKYWKTYYRISKQLIYLENKFL